jgi:hypothetical protein
MPINIDALNQTISDTTTQPERVASDGLEVRARPLSDILAAVQYLAAVEAVAGMNDFGGPLSAWGGCVRPARMMPPAAVGPLSSEN